MVVGPTTGDFHGTTRDKRRYTRLCVSSAATLGGGAEPGSDLWVCNLSRGGLLLDSRRTRRPSPRLELQLHLPWVDPIRVEGRPIHWSAGGRSPGRLGVEFIGLRRSAELAIDQVLEAAWCCGLGNQSTVLAITDSVLTRCSLERDFYLLETCSVIVDSLPQLLRWLHDWEARVDAVLVDAGLQALDPLALLRNLGEFYPQIRRVAIVDALQDHLWLPTARTRLADRILFDPWDEGDLEAALRS